MSTAPHMPLFCGDYLADTMTLNMEQSGAYLQILMVTWRNGGAALPDDDAVLARICRMTVNRFRCRVRKALEPLFDLSNGTWRNERLEREWKIVQQKIEAKRANGSKGGRPPKHDPGEGPKPDHESSPASMHDSDPVQTDNSLKNNETTKANGYDSPKLTKSTHPHIDSTYREEDSSPYVDTQKPSPAPVGAGSGPVAYSGPSFKLNEKKFGEFKATYWAIPDFLTALKTLDAQLAGTNPEKIYQVLHARLNAMHQCQLRIKQDRAEQQKAKTIVKRRPGNRVIGGINARAS